MITIFTISHQKNSCELRWMEASGCQRGFYFEIAAVNEWFRNPVIGCSGLHSGLPHLFAGEAEGREGHPVPN